MSEHIEIERKFLVSGFQIPLGLDCLHNHIVQWYLKDGSRLRVMMTAEERLLHSIAWVHTFKTPISGSNMSRVERERNVTQVDAAALLAKADPAFRPLSKFRHSFYQGDLLKGPRPRFDLDDFRPWKDLTILEVELKSEDQDFSFPSFIQVEREVTDDPQYLNVNLARWPDP